MKTLMRKLIASKSHTYGTRQLVAGDEYEASRVHSRILVAAKLASYAPEQPERPPMVTMTVTRGAAPEQPATDPASAATSPERTKAPKVNPREGSQERPGPRR